jgi:YD repeat-containing protein
MVATVRDNAGRVVSQRSGQGPFGVPADDETYSQVDVLSYRGDVAEIVERREPRSGTGAVYQSTYGYDTLGRIREVVEAGNYLSTTQYDEAGNAIVSLPAGHATPWVRHYDSRGLLVREEAPEGTTRHQEYDPRGVMRRYIDEAGKETTYGTDELGRVRSITYEDGSSEELLYENVTGQLAARKARNGKWFSHYYDTGGRVLEVRVADAPRSSDPSAEPTGEPWRRYLYDFGGRLRRVTSGDAAVEYDDRDWMGRPRVTRSIRYRDHSGLSASPEVLDVHTQGHVWSVYEGERERWRMPAAGSALPGAELGGRWRAWIVEEHDAAGNISGLKAAIDGTSPPEAWILNASARGAGRRMWRSRYFDPGGNAEQVYSYADGLADLPPGPVSGDLVRSVIQRNGMAVAGSEVSRDAA